MKKVLTKLCIYDAEGTEVAYVNNGVIYSTSGGHRIGRILGGHRARRPWQIESGLNGSDVASEAYGKILQRRGDRRVEYLSEAF